MTRKNAEPQIIACGINYDNGSKFRSTAVIEFGQPYSLPEEDIERYKSPETSKELVNEFLEHLSRQCLTSATRLNDVKITADSQEDLIKLYMARNLYLSDEGNVSKENELMVVRNFKQNYSRAGNNQDMIALFKDISEYITELNYCGVKDWELKSLEASRIKSWGIMIKSLIILIIGSFIVPFYYP